MHYKFDIRSKEMKEYWTFEKFLEFANSYGYEFISFWNPYRIFANSNDPDELHWLIPVYDKKVDIENVRKFKKWLKGKGIL